MKRKLRQLFAVASIATTPGGLGALLRWKPFSITAYKMAHALKAQGLTFRTIIDCGANKGQFARAATECFPHASVFSVEPLPDAAKAFRRNLGKREQVRLIQMALGSEDEPITFYPNQYSLASSALPMHDNQRIAFPKLTELPPIQVQAGRLDTLLADLIRKGPTLLKLDLQGFELEALRGATDILDQIDFILLEVSFKEMYQGEPLFNEVRQFLDEAGFHFLRPVETLADHRGEIVQMDALFARKP